MATALLRAGLHGAELNVAINLGGIEDAAYASVLCYNKQYQQTFAEGEKTIKHREKKEDEGEGGKKKGKKKGKEGEPSRDEMVQKLKPKDFSPLEQGMLHAYQRYVCFVPDSEDLPTIKYRRARIYYETRHPIAAKFRRRVRPGRRSTKDTPKPRGCPR